MTTQSCFIEQFGSTPQLRVFDFLLDNHFFDYPVTQIARQSQVSYNSLMSFLPSWVDQGIVIRTRKIGKSPYYMLNVEHPFVQQMMRVDWSLATAHIEQEQV